MSRKSARRPRVFGTGLIALDVVSESKDSKPQLFAGGTCGNVLAILSHLGWTATPIGRLDTEFAGTFVRSDLQRWGVDTSLLSLSPTARTPVIFQKIRTDRNGVPYHTFSFYCPECGHRVPGFQPVTARTVESIKHLVTCVDVFFVDRVSKGAIVLAESIADSEGLIVFEPASSDGSKAFKRMVELAHIVKYSNERLDDLGMAARDSPHVEVQTLGRGGLRYRTRGRHWSHMDAEPLIDLKDAAGAGDWLTAGLIHAFRGKTAQKMREIRNSELTKALSFGQSLAAWNCQFVGARGGMYSNCVSEIDRLSKRWLNAKVMSIQKAASESEDGPLASFCMTCSADKTASPVRSAGRSA